MIPNRTCAGLLRLARINDSFAFVGTAALVALAGIGIISFSHDDLRLVMRSSFIAVLLSTIALFAINSQTRAAEANSQAASSTSSAASHPSGGIRIRAQCMGQDEKLYGSPVVEVAENTPEAKLAAAEAACRPILEKAGSDWDSACAAYVAQLRPLTDEFMVLMNSGLRLDDPSFAELKTRREEVYRQFPECSAGRPVLRP